MSGARRRPPRAPRRAGHLVGTDRRAVSASRGGRRTGDHAVRHGKFLLVRLEPSTLAADVSELSTNGCSPRMETPMNNWKPAFALLLVFAAGIALGAVGTRMIVQRDIRQMVANPEIARDRIELQLVRRLRRTRCNGSG